MKKWIKKSSCIVLGHPFMKILNDRVVLPDGKEKDWVYWSSTDSVMIIGMLEDKRLVMIRQYRYLVDDEVIEFPSGRLDRDESPEAGARREFEEETGYKCDSLVKLGAFYETYGQLNRKIHIFFSDKLTPSKQTLDDVEQIEVMLVDPKEAIQMASENRIVSMGSSLAILLLKEKMQI